jgi:cardiolipin synthase
MDLSTYLAIGGGAAYALGFFSGLHALLRKRDPRGQLMWLAVCVGLPAIGALFYWVFGVNRIRTRARRWQEKGRFDAGRQFGVYERAAAALSNQHPEVAEEMLLLLQISERVTGRPLVGGNQVEPLRNGESAYPAMIEAIDNAQSCIFLCTYLFDTDKAGRDFVDALVRAGERGVKVHVLLDAIGERHARPRAGKLLAGKKGVAVARFLPLSFSLRGLRINLRNHRKIFTVDGKVGFTGGMNIGQRHMVDDPDNRNITADMHFRMRGPVVRVLEEVFCEDWYFATGNDVWQSEEEGAQPCDGEGPKEPGTALCRGVRDGPNEDYEMLQWILVGALTCARRSVKILTPYFIPSRELLAALKAAVLRGAEVELVLPEKSNLRFVDWATNALLDEVIEMGVIVYHQPSPFDHSKLLIVDDFYVNLGSANLDPRSLQLNFEFNVEVFDPRLAKSLSEHVDAIVERSRRVTRVWLESRNLLAKLRDATVKIASPYL